jgi:uncharacterized protein
MRTRRGKSGPVVQGRSHSSGNQTERSPGMWRFLIAVMLTILICGGNLSAQQVSKAKRKATHGHKITKRTGIAPRYIKSPARPVPTLSNPAGPRLTAVARSDQDSVVLRWAPNTPLAWLAGNRHGYIVERITMLKDVNAARATLRSLSREPIRPWSLKEWEERISKDDRYQAVAVQALYGKTFVPGPDVGPTTALKEAADELTNRFGFALFAADVDPTAADGLGLRFVDKDVKPGETYSYRIYLAGKDSLIHLDTAFTVGTASAFTRPPAPVNLVAESGEHSVTLRWKSPIDPRGGLTAFYIYRSSGSGNNYDRLNSVPFVTATRGKLNGDQVFTDTSAIDYVHYRYKVEGITPFADVSLPAFVEGFAEDLTPPPPPTIKKPVQLKDGVVQISWDMPKTSPDLAGFVVSRSSFALKDYRLLLRPGARMPSPGKSAGEETRELMKLILPASARTFVDSNATTKEPYYVVGAVDTAGNLAQSLPAYLEVMDTARPSMPEGLTGIIDKEGIVHLRWRLGPESNIIGYRVLWANDPNHEFSQRVNRPLPDTTFVDTVNIHTLSHYIYYRVAAVSDRYIQSPLSEILSLRRPDVVPPASPVFLDVRVTDESVALRWARSPSDDVEKQVLTRRTEGEEGWHLLRTLGKSDTAYLDTLVQQDVVYEYRIEAVDSSGLHSVPSPAVEGRPYDTGVREPISDLSGQYNKRKKEVLLRWKYFTRKKEKYWFVVYRSENQSPVMEYSSAPGNVREFRDARVRESDTYRYTIRVKVGGGAQSPLSDTVAVDIKAQTSRKK